jgi:LacI family transcriptional regulator
VFFCNSDDDPVKQRNYLRVLQEKRIDGLIVASAGEDAVLAQTLADSQAPLVVVDRNIEAASRPRADRPRARRVSGHAASARARPREDRLHHRPDRHGRQRDACTASSARWPSAASTSCRARSPKAIFVPRRLSRGGAAVRVQPSAIFAGNDLMGVGAARGGRARHPRAGRMLDHRLRRHRVFPLPYPALSTVGQSVRALGEMAAQTLIERIGGGSTAAPSRRRVVSPRLVLRESTSVYREPAMPGARA